MNRKSETPRNFGCLNGFEKSELFSQETYHSQNFRYETLKSHLLEMLSVSLSPHFNSCESHKRFKVHLCHFHSSENE